MSGATASTQVHFATLSPHEIEAYVATGEPLRVAGAFTIDGQSPVAVCVTLTAEPPRGGEGARRLLGGETACARLDPSPPSGMGR